MSVPRVPPVALSYTLIVVPCTVNSQRFDTATTKALFVVTAKERTSPLSESLCSSAVDPLTNQKVDPDGSAAACTCSGAGANVVNAC